MIFPPLVFPGPGFVLLAQVFPSHTFKLHALKSLASLPWVMGRFEAQILQLEAMLSPIFYLLKRQFLNAFFTFETFLKL